MLLQLQCTDRSMVKVANNTFTQDYCGYQPDDKVTCNLTAHNTVGSSLKQTVDITKSCASTLFFLISTNSITIVIIITTVDTIFVMHLSMFAAFYKKF